MSWDWVGLVGTGQSLSSGVGAPTPVNTTQPYGNLKIYDATGAYYYGAAPLSMVPLTSIVRVRNALAPTWPNYPDNLDGETLHEEISNQVSAQAVAAGSSYVSIPHVVGISGAPMSYIDKRAGYNSYAASLWEITNVKALATAAGKSYGVGAIFFTHGEADSASSTYQAEIVQLHSDYVTDIQAITGQTGSVPMFLTQQCSVPGSSTQRSVSTLAAWNVSRNDPDNFVLVGPKYQYGYISDNVHMDVASYERLGAKNAQAYYQHVVQGVRWVPLQPAAVHRIGRTITISFDVPYLPLQWHPALSNPHPHQATHAAWSEGKGFEVENDAGEQVIESVAIDGINVVITLVDDPADTNLVVRYAMTQDGSGFQAGTILGRKGLLIDSDPFVGRDREDIAVTVTSGSTEVSAVTPGAMARRATWDRVSGTGLTDAYITSFNGVDTPVLSEVWAGATGTTTLTFQHDHRNFCVQFELPVPRSQVSGGERVTSYDIEWNADIDSADGPVSVGDVLTKNSDDLWVRATTANRLAGWRPTAIARDPGATTGPRINVQFSGEVPAAVTGLGAGSQEYANCGSDARMERSATITVDTIGTVDPLGNVTLDFTLALGGGGGSVTVPSGTGVIHASGGVMTTVGPVVLTSEVSGVLPIANGGTGLSSVGANGYVLTSNGTAMVWAAAGGGSIAYGNDLDAASTNGNQIVVALTGSAGSVLVRGTAGITFGSNASTTGDIRARNNTTIIAARRFQNDADMSLIATDANNYIQYGDNTYTVVSFFNSLAQTAFVISGITVARFIAGALQLDYLQFGGNRICTVNNSGQINATTAVPVANGGTGLTALGSSLQVLRTNSTATAMEWATLSTGGSPGGSNTQIQYNNGGVFGGAANFTYSAGIVSIAAASALAFGATPATAGAIRMSSAMGIAVRNAANSGNLTLANTDSSDKLYYGDPTTGSTTIVRSPTSVDIQTTTTSRFTVTSTTATFNVSTIALASGVVTHGTTVATTGDYRIKNAWTKVGRNAANSADATLFNWDSSNNLTLGDSTNTGAVTLGASTAILGILGGTTRLKIGATCTSILTTNLSVGVDTPGFNSATNTVFIGDGTAPSAAPTNGVYLQADSGRLRIRSNNVPVGGAAVNLILDGVVGGFSSNGIDTDHAIKIIIDKPGAPAQTRWIRFYA